MLFQFQLLAESCGIGYSKRLFVWYREKVAIDAFSDAERNVKVQVFSHDVFYAEEIISGKHACPKQMIGNLPDTS
jgi:hypothetical protein